MSKLAHLKNNSITNLQKRMKELKENSSGKKSDYWKLTLDEKKSGSAVIRFLPPKEADQVPYVEIKEFNVKKFHPDINKNKYYLFRSLESIGQKDPAKDEFWAHHNIAKTDDEKKKARIFNDRLIRIVNVYVVDDKHAPENNGKVFKMKVTPAIWKLIEEKIFPKFEDINPVNVFDFWEGCNLRVRAYKDEKSGMVSYDSSEWDGQTALFDNDDEIEKVYDQLHDLSSEISPENKEYSLGYEERKEKLREVVGGDLLIDVVNKDSEKRTDNIANAFKDDIVTEKDSVGHKEPKVDSKVSSDNNVDDDEELMKLLNES